MTRVALVSLGFDTGGQGIGLKRAFDAHGDGWSARAIRRKNSSMNYPADVTWLRRDRRTTRIVEQVVAEADVLHIMQVPGSVRHLRHAARKPVIVQHHGTYFRTQPRAVSAMCRAMGATEAVIDYGLMELAPHAHFLPAVVDLDAMAALRAEHYAPGDKVRVFHSPTDRALKSTAALIAAMDRLARRYPVELVLVEGATWAECLRRKATADIVFDQVLLGYGINAIEAWGMGIPVVAGMADRNARQRMLDAWGTLPFVEATPDTIEAALEPLIADAELRTAFGRVGQSHAERIHSQRAVVERATALYDRALQGVAA